MHFAELTGKVAIVTGAASGIGLSSAAALAREGVRVVLADLPGDGLGQAEEALVAQGMVVAAHRADVTSAVQVEELVAATVERFGRLDILVNNAGIPQTGMQPLCDVDEAMFDRVLAVNLKGVWLGMKYAIPAMQRHGGGVVVNMSSSAGLVGQAGVGVYSAAKHGVLGLTKCASLEYGMAGIRINAICPGAVDSPIRQHRRAQYSQEEWDARSRSFHPATGRDGTAEEIAAVVLFLCSDGASNIHGTAIPVDGGRVAQ